MTLFRLNNPNITQLPHIPEETTELDLSECSGLTTLPVLPAGITRLNLSECSGLTTLPVLPAGINWLSLDGWRRLTTLPFLPADINFLNLRGCSSLTALPVLPTSITWLTLNGCSRLTALPVLPAGITELDLNGCSGLTDLPDLPEGITELDLRGCNSLPLDILPRLQELEQSGVDIRYPEHLARLRVSGNDIRLARLDNIIKLHARQQNLPHPTSPAISTLLQRFLSEGLYARGAIPLAQIDSVLELFEQDPKNLKWAEEVASRYLTGCINQPVNGWMEISALAHIARQDTIENKIIAARYLMTLDVIKQSITDLEADKKPGRETEVEFGNAMIKIIHNMLLREGKIAAWPGIPDGIAYFPTIARLLSEDVVTKIYKIVGKQVFSKKQREIEEYLCTAHSDAWQQINWTPKMKAIEKEYDEARTVLSMAAGWMEEDESSPDAIARRAVITELRSLRWDDDKFQTAYKALEKELEQKLNEATPKVSTQRRRPKANEDYLTILKRLERSLAPRIAPVAAASSGATGEADHPKKGILAGLAALLRRRRPYQSMPAQAAAASIPQEPAPYVARQEAQNLDAPQRDEDRDR